jgi:DNA-binding LacI/PurR family transcriptional regulator
VVLDDTPGVVAGVHHLVALGHERIAFVGGPDAFLHARRRQAAWRATLDRMTLPTNLVLDGDFTGTGGAEATRRLLALAPGERPTAIVYANDLMAVAGVAGAVRSGRRVPEDVSVVGFDDCSVAAHMHPALTTVAQDAMAWGRAAAGALFDLVEHTSTDDVELPPARLVVRQSTAAPAGAIHTPEGDS